MCEKKLRNIFNDVSKIINLKLDLLQKYIDLKLYEKVRSVNVKNSRFHFLSYCPLKKHLDCQNQNCSCYN
jgi:hypothetical protein